MQKDTHVTLGEHFEGFIAAQIAQGKYASVSEAVRAGLRLLEEYEARAHLLRQALIDGEESGLTKYSLDALIEEMDRESTQS